MSPIAVYEFMYASHHIVYWHGNKLIWFDYEGEAWYISKPYDMKHTFIAWEVVVSSPSVAFYAWP